MDFGTGQSFNQDKFERAAADAAEKRRKGTHVYHPQHGLVEVDEARAKNNAGVTKPSDWKGNPDAKGQPVDWNKTNQK